MFEAGGWGLSVDIVDRGRWRREKIILLKGKQTEAFRQCHLNRVRSPKHVIGAREEVTAGDKQVNTKPQCDGCENKTLHSLCSFPCGSFPPARMWVLQGEEVSFVYFLHSQHTSECAGEPRER